MSQYPSHVPQGYEMGPPPPDYASIAQTDPIDPPKGYRYEPAVKFCVNKEHQTIECPNCMVTLVPVAVQPQLKVENKEEVVFGKIPQKIICTNCNTEQVTIVKRKFGDLNYLVCWLTAFILFILGIFLIIPFLLMPLAIIAYCIPALKDIKHVCPNCNYTNGVYKQIK